MGHYSGSYRHPLVMIAAVPVSFSIVAWLLGPMRLRNIANSIQRLPGGTWATRHWLDIVRGLGLLMLMASAIIGYYWFYVLAPLRHQLDPDWLRRHSLEAQWNEAQTRIRRGSWGHDDGFLAANCGDAEFMAWVMVRTQPGDDISSCRAGHRDTAFRGITNQDVGEEAAAWLDWWKKNRSKSQLEWHRDGFALCGVTVSIPPSPQDTVPLLQLLGDSHATNPVPDHIQHNAFRWLRDSGFNPVEFALRADGDLEDIAKSGLVKYLKYERTWPARDGVGIVPFTAPENPYTDMKRAPIATPEFQTKVHTAIVGLFYLGAVLLAWVHRRCVSRSANA